jgi:hypothetical protein
MQMEAQLRTTSCVSQLGFNNQIFFFLYLIIVVLDFCPWFKEWCPSAPFCSCFCQELVPQKRQRQKRGQYALSLSLSRWLNPVLQILFSIPELFYKTSKPVVNCICWKAGSCGFSKQNEKECEYHVVCFRRLWQYSQCHHQMLKFFTNVTERPCDLGCPSWWCYCWALKSSVLGLSVPRSLWKLIVLMQSGWACVL